VLQEGEDSGAGIPEFELCRLISVSPLDDVARENVCYC